MFTNTLICPLCLLVELSSDKSKKEYTKYYEQYENALNSFCAIINSLEEIEGNIFTRGTLKSLGTISKLGFTNFISMSSSSQYLLKSCGYGSN